MEFLLTFIGTVAAIMASFFSWLGYVISKRAEERARPCIGETLWTERSDSYFVTLKIFPGQYFVQTNRLKLLVRNCRMQEMSLGMDVYSPQEKKYRAFLTLFTVPVNRDIVELKVCITPKLKVPFEIKVNLAGDHKPLVYHVYENPFTSRTPADKV